MRTTILGQARHPALSIDLEEDERIYAEPGTRVHQTNVILHLVEHGAKDPNPLRNIKRLLTSRIHRQYSFTGKEGGGNVTLAPSLDGEILPHPMEPGDCLVTGWRSLLASTHTIRVNPNWPKLNDMLLGDSIYLLHLEAGAQPATAFLNAYGGLQQHAVTRTSAPLTVGANHLVAFTPTLLHRVQRNPGMDHHYHGGAGLVVRFTGEGTVWTQTGNIRTISSETYRHMPGLVA